MNSTVTALIKTPAGDARVGVTVSFKPVSDLSISGTFQTQTVDFITNGTGQISASLAKGKYRVYVDSMDDYNKEKDDYFSINVPGDGQTYPIKSLVDNTELVYS